MSFILNGYKIGLPLYFEKQVDADENENTMYESFVKNRLINETSSALELCAAK